MLEVCCVLNKNGSSILYGHKEAKITVSITLWGNLDLNPGLCFSQALTFILNHLAKPWHPRNLCVIYYISVRRISTTTSKNELLKPDRISL